MDDLRTANAALDASRRHLADAPAWARDAIDQARENRGLPALFKGTASTSGVKARSLRPARTLVGVAAPAVSQPHRLEHRGTAGRELLPEVISPAAWACVEADLLMGQTFDFRTGHAGKPWARSDDPDIAIEFDPIAGMLFTIRGAAAQRFAWPGGGTASIAFEVRSWQKRFTKGYGWIRQIDRMRLGHVALLPPHYDPPAYRQARVLSVPPEQTMKAFVNLRCDARLATKEALGR